jgi:hypothetical protein
MVPPTRGTSPRRRTDDDHDPHQPPPPRLRSAPPPGCRPPARRRRTLEGWLAHGLHRARAHCARRRDRGDATGSRRLRVPRPNALDGVTRAIPPLAVARLAPVAIARPSPPVSPSPGSPWPASPSASDTVRGLRPDDIAVVCARHPQVHAVQAHLRPDAAGVHVATDTVQASSGPLSSPGPPTAGQFSEFDLDPGLLSVMLTRHRRRVPARRPRRRRRPARPSNPRQPQVARRPHDPVWRGQHAHRRVRGAARQDRAVVTGTSPVGRLQLAPGPARWSRPCHRHPGDGGGVVWLVGPLGPATTARDPLAAAVAVRGRPVPAARGRGLLLGNARRPSPPVAHARLGPLLLDLSDPLDRACWRLGLRLLRDRVAPASRRPG